MSRQKARRVAAVLGVSAVLAGGAIAHAATGGSSPGKPATSPTAVTPAAASTPSSTATTTSTHRCPHMGSGSSGSGSGSGSSGSGSSSSSSNTTFGL